MLRLEEEGVQIVRTNAACSIWCLGYVLVGKLYFTKHDDSLVPENKNPEPIPNLAVKAAPTASPQRQACAVF